MPAKTIVDNTELIDVSELVAGVKDRTIALPEFQRDFMWNEDEVAALLVSIARGWPTGTFLLLSGDQVKNFQAKPVERAPDIDENLVETLVLDGQQRLTGLYHAFENQSDYVYYLQLGAVRDRGRIDDDDIRAERRRTFVKSYSDMTAEAKARIIPIHRIVRDEQFQEWIDLLPDDDRSGWFGTRENLLPGLRNYGIPAVNLRRDVPLEAVAKIFETINSTGQSLTTFDLMVARLYPHGFRLKDQWVNACEKYPDTMEDTEDLPKRARGDRVSGIDVLKLIALWETLGPERTTGTNTPNGVRESDVLKLRPKTVIENWDRALASLDRAIHFVREHCGVIRWNLLPSKVMLFPLADALQTGEPNATTADRLEAWFWGAIMHTSYATSTSTQPITDARQLRAWITDEAAKPRVVAEMPSDNVLLEQLREEGPRKFLSRGVASLLCSLGATDWLTRARLLDASLPIEIHHIFPKEYNKNRGLASADAIANMTPILGATNKSLRNDAPPQVLEREAIRNVDLESHLIDVDAYGAAEYDDFLEKRARAILEAFNNKLARST